MRKLFITCILVGVMVPLFQNCGQKFHGNGDPYEDTGLTSIDPTFSSEEPGNRNGQILAQQTSRVCTGTGKIMRVEFQDLSASKELISIQTKDGKQRSVTNLSAVSSLTLNVTFDSGIVIKSLDVLSNSVRIGIDISGSTSYEQLNCVVYN